MLFPFAGIMASILKAERTPLNIFLNFVKLCDFPKNKIPMWMQVFNRHDHTLSEDYSRQTLSLVKMF